MSAATLERASAPALWAAESEQTLDEVISDAWTELAGHQTISCPLCAHTMAPSYGVHALPTGGRCGSCGAELR
jgi:hypothetical protein